MGLKNIDKSAEQKGSGIVTLWQFVKFIVVSLLACIVQFASLNLIMLLPQIKAIMNQDFTWFVFSYVGEGKGFGYFLAFNIANILAQIVAFFVNREKTFGSSSNIAITLPIYIVLRLHSSASRHGLLRQFRAGSSVHSACLLSLPQIFQRWLAQQYSSSSISRLTKFFSIRKKRKNKSMPHKLRRKP